MAPAGKELWAQRGPDLRLRQVGEVVGSPPYPWRGKIFIQQALKYLPSYIPLNGTSPFSQTWMGVLLKVLN